MDDMIYLRDVNYENWGQMYWPKGDDGAFLAPLKDWQETIEVIMESVEKNNVVVQAGGCCGMYPVFFSSLFTKVYTFEPDDLNYFCLEKNISSYKNVFAQKKALHDDETSCTMLKASPGGDEMNVGMHRIGKIGEGETETTTIDSLQLDDCDLIHLDAEGHEVPILYGAADTISKFKPVVVLEDNPGIAEVVMNMFGYVKVQDFRMDKLYIHQTKIQNFFTIN